MGTPQGGVISPLDWNLVADWLLGLMNIGGCYAQIYADDFAVFTFSSNLSTAFNLMQCMLSRVTSWYNW